MAVGDDADLPALRRHGGARVRWRSSLTMPKMGRAYAEGLRHFLGGGCVGNAAVDEKDVRQRQKLLGAVGCPLELRRRSTSCMEA